MPLLIMILLSSLPGLSDKIPGLDLVYLPEQAQKAAIELYKSVFKASFVLIPFALLVNFGLSQLPGTGHTVFKALGRTLVVIAVLLSGPYIYGTFMASGQLMAEVIIEGKDVQKLNKDIREAARKAQDDRGVDNGQLTNKKGYFERLAEAINISTTGLIADQVIALSSILFLISQVAIQFLFRVLAIILFVIMPFMIILALVPIVGNRVFMGWLGATFQLAMWQPWIAICTFFVKTADDIVIIQAVQPGDAQGRSITNHAESAAISLVFTILLWATPKVVATLFPFSGINTVGAGAATAGTLAGGFALTRALSGVVNAVRRRRSGGNMQSGESRADMEGGSSESGGSSGLGGTRGRVMNPDQIARQSYNRSVNRGRRESARQRGNVGGGSGIGSGGSGAVTDDDMDSGSSGGSSGGSGGRRGGGGSSGGNGGNGGNGGAGMGGGRGTASSSGDGGSDSGSGSGDMGMGRGRGAGNMPRNRNRFSPRNNGNMGRGPNTNGSSAGMDTRANNSDMFTDKSGM